MNDLEADVAEQIRRTIQQASNFSERSLQSKDFRIGVSDLGFCSEYTKRQLLNIPEEWESDATAAFIGTAVGDHVEKAVKELLWPTAITQSSVLVRLEGDDGRVYEIPGHPDLIVPEKGLLLDFKTVNGLETTRRLGAKKSQQFQRHCYAKAAHEAGLFADGIALADVMVGNVWIDRSGAEPLPHVQIEPFNPDLVAEAEVWLDDVVYAVIHDEPVPKEPSYEFCQNWCGHFRTCRAGDLDAEGLLTDPEVLTAVQMHTEAGELERRAKKLKAQAKGALKGVSGSTGEYTVKWVHVNGSNVSFTREPYEKLDVRKAR